MSYLSFNEGSFMVKKAQVASKTGKSFCADRRTGVNQVSRKINGYTSKPKKDEEVKPKPQKTALSQIKSKQLPIKPKTRNQQTF